MFNQVRQRTVDSINDFINSYLMDIPEPRISFVTENAIILLFAEPALNPGETSAYPEKPVLTDSDQILQERICRLARALRQSDTTRVLLQDIVPAPGSLLLSLHDGRKARRLLREAEAIWQSCDDIPDEARMIEIPVTYGGQAGYDLEHVARHTGLTTDEIINTHRAGSYYVQSLGFMPGFAYLGGLHPSLATPRKTTPDPRIRPGSVAIGGAMTGIYPSASPGGWHVIGHTDICLFDPRQREPCLLLPGDQVQFVMAAASGVYP